MNSEKFKDALYEPRRARDVRDLFAHTCAEHAEQIAFWFRHKHSDPWQSVTYEQFKKDIDALGTAFVSRGLKDKRIAIIGENSYEWVVCYLATVMGAGVAVPIDRELKSGEIANLMNRAKVNAVCYSNKMERTMKEVLPQVASVDLCVNMNEETIKGRALPMKALIEEGQKELEAGNRQFLGADIAPHQVAAILFTSGTTGLAKGVMLSHHNLVSNVYNMSKYVCVEGERSLSVLPMHHSYEMTCHIFTGLSQGVEVVICEGIKFIQANLQEMHCSVMLAVPLIFETIHKKIMKTAASTGRLEKLKKGIKMSKKLKLYNKPWVVKRMFKEVQESLGANVKHFIAGGAAISATVIEDFEAMGFPIIQGYGMTENSPIIAVNKDRYSKAAAAGLPMPETEIEISDPDESGMGEIIIKGPSVMVGYFENEEATAETMRDGWLLTGDYGYFDEDGFLYVSGRKKNVIVTKNGKNIFPEEVEYYLTESEYIEEVLVVGADSGTDKGIVVKAIIFPNYPAIEAEKGDLSKEEIHAFIEEVVDDVNDKMPVYKRVQRFSIRESEFEKTTTRKIKRYNDANLIEEEDTIV